MAAMTSYHSENCRHLLSAHAVSARCQQQRPPTLSTVPDL